MKLARSNSGYSETPHQLNIDMSVDEYNDLIVISIEIALNLMKNLFKHKTFSIEK